MAEDMTSVTHVSPAEAAFAIDEGARLIDVREADEWAVGHAPMADHVPLADLLAGAELPPGSLVVVCRTGNRSGRAAAALAERGRDAVNLAGGMRAWKAAGLPVVCDDGRAGDVA